jgi:hypothetical protein
LPLGFIVVKGELLPERKQTPRPSERGKSEEALAADEIDCN